MAPGKGPLELDRRKQQWGTLLPLVWLWARDLGQQPVGMTEEMRALRVLNSQNEMKANLERMDTRES